MKTATATTIRRWLIKAALIAVAAAGLAWLATKGKPGADPTAIQASRQKSHQRLTERVREQMAAGPQITRHATPHGELLTILVPVPNRQMTWLDYKECYLWRDSQYKTTSLSCPTEVDPHDLPID